MIFRRVVARVTFGAQRTWRRALSYPAHEVVGLPALSPTMSSGVIANWKVSEGGSYAAGDVICEVETDKATVDFEAQDDGIVAKILAQAGNEVQVGSPIMVIVEDEKDIPAFADFEAPAGTAETSAPPPSAPAPAPAPAAPELASAAPTPAAAPKPSGRVFASPLARKLAAEKGYDISLIKGTGPNGRIVAEDVETYKPTAAAAAASSSPAAPSPAASSPDIASAGSQAGSFDFHISPQSAAIAARLTYSMQTAPHYYLTVELALEAALELLDKLNSSLEPEEIISVTDLFVKASASATTAVPAVNASWLADAGIIRSYERFDLNLVVGHCEGLVAPAIIDVQRLGLGQIAKETKAALAALEDDSAESKPYTCGTFSLINLGAFGVSSAATIVPSPQACALSLGTIENKLVPADTESGFAVKPVLVATLSADHRVVDGAVGAQWLQALKNLIETPHNLLL